MLIDVPAKSSRIPPLFRQAYRPFFLLGPLFGLAALWLWVLSFLTATGFSPYGGGLWWHAHEMLFGFVAAIVAGFLLTAVQNWTNIPGVRGWPLAAPVALWALARLLEAVPLLPPGLIAAVDLAFLPAVAATLARPVLGARQWKNLVFVPILAMLSVANLLTYIAIWTGQPAWFERGAQGAVLLIVVLITVLGGRVIPFFTARGTNTENIAPLPLLEKLAVVSTVLMALVALGSGWRWQAGIPAAAIALVAAGSHLARQLRWRPFSTGKEPLLWSLHLAYAFMAPGFLLAAAYSLGLLATPTYMIHAFTVGVISPLILAMIARVSLGHSGRILKVAPPMKVAFAAASSAGLSRALLPAMGFTSHWLVYVLSAALWSVAFGLFVWHYAEIFVKPRSDGRMG